MRIALLAFFTLFFGIPAHLQITMNSEDLPQPGTNYPLVNTVVLNLGLLDTNGANAVWDASNLTSIGDAPITPIPISEASITAALVFNSPFNTAYQCDYFLPTEFPDLGIDLGIPLDGFNSFYQTDANHYSIAGIGLSSSGFDLPVTYDDIDELFPLPFSFGETFTSSGAFSLDLTGILGYWLNQTREVAADGWGTLILPSGSYEVLRTRTDLVATDSLLIAELDEPFAIDRIQTIYQWWGEGMGFPLLEVTTALGVPIVSTFQDLQAQNNILNETIVKPSLYPNPARGGTTIRWQGSRNSSWALSNMNGKQVACGSGNNWVIPASFAAGTYLFTQNGVTGHLIIGQ